VVLSFGIYYFGQSLGRTDSLVLSSFAIVSYVLLALLTTLGVVADRGLFAAPEAAFSSRVFAIGAATAVLIMTLRMARVSRAALRRAIEHSNETLLLAQRREAQLIEARHQLAHALQVTVGKPGRYTGTLAGEYRLENVIGVGAIGEVYAAQHVSSAQRAAVKLLQASALLREDLIGRFMREGSISVKLDDPHIVRVFEVGRLEDGAPYLAMELLEGRDLAARLRQEGQLPLDELMRLASALGAGLQHAYDAGVVHRDLKPLNIFEAVEDRKLCWKILDFGISKLTSSSGTLTQEGVVGTPGYMSPEQARGSDVDHRSDVFSMAVVLFRALTGQPAFPGDNTPQILFDVVYKVARRPSHAAKQIPAEVDLVLAIAMAKEPADRFQSAAEFARAFVLACKQQLTEELQARGRDAVRAYPWGTTLTQRREG
jgi:serine/threonine-protein kinase